MKHDLFKIKRVAQAVSLAAVLLSAPAAYSATVDWGVHDDTEFAQILISTSGAFEDSFLFTMTPGGGLTSVAVSNNLPGSFLITSGNVDLWLNGITTTFVASYSFDGGSGSTPHVFSNLAAGSYTYKVSGIAGSPADGFSRGLYSLTSSLNPVSPVPEPEIYAMMAAGLGLMGFIGRRRARRDSTSA